MSAERIIFIDGAVTSLQAQDTHKLQIATLLQHNIEMVTNPTIGNADYIECAFDWLYCATEIGLFGFPVHNPSSMDLYHELWNAYTKNPDQDLHLIGYSQGTLIVISGCIALSKKGQVFKDFLKNKVKVTLIGCVVPKFKCDMMSKRLKGIKYFVRDDDPLAQQWCLGRKVTGNGHQFDLYLDYLTQ